MMEEQKTTHKKPTAMIVKTKFSKKSIQSQLTIGDFYVCPFTGLEKIWLGDRGERRFFEVNPSVEIKKCWAKLLREKEYKNQFVSAGKILKSI